MTNKNENTGLSNVWIELLSKVIVSFFPLLIFGMNENSVMFGMIWMQTSNVLIQSLADILKQTYHRYRTTNDATLHILDIHNHYMYLSWFVYHEVQSIKPHFSLNNKEIHIIACDEIISFVWNGVDIKVFCEKQMENKRSQLRLVVSSKYLRDIHAFINDCDARYNEWLEHTRSKSKTQEMWLYNKYLLTGPPGCGKTTFQYVISNILKWDIVKISATNLTNKTFQRLINKTLPYTIVSIDDVDRLPSFTNKEEMLNLKENENVKTDDEDVTLNDGDPIHLKTLLDIFDGYEYLHGCILVLTCNDATKLNPTLMRSGRIDVKQEISLPNLKCVCNMLKTVYGEKSEKVVDDWQTFVISKKPTLERSVGICMAEILNTHVIKNKLDIEQTLKQLGKTFLKE